MKPLFDCLYPLAATTAALTALLSRRRCLIYQIYPEFHWLPKSVASPLALGIAEKLGGYPRAAGFGSDYTAR